ncbi:hypothetical protein K6L44_15515 [Gluconacetobacter entanii]|jgi:hypothetical protein|uniref:hypothetical protein n=1 Tax=Gluconacetobacter entanii TaxID=108528 RepID=UPI001C935A47|nr:hypothetical protein [Gluconacetobacter entanii]MBY4641365.1 hypothetical protein [Gluconacetobacter entanii]MCW4578905.1 hypothetical protein [Gluconacetobacter entanii]MCW4582305.1 hypothetical protein [Gluconacetobacter entanii]MCW4585688.1 hypothetical protein [Gluconacetobacter entanii]
MSHNYATPMTPEKRLARVLSRIPADWSIRVERTPGEGDAMSWRAAVGPQQAGQETQWCTGHDTMVDALEAAWRHARQQ